MRVNYCVTPFDRFIRNLLKKKAVQITYPVLKWCDECLGTLKLHLLVPIIE